MKSRLLGAVCACSLLFPLTGSATTVWGADYTSNVGDSWTFYLVTEGDNTTALGNLTGLNIDRTLTSCALIKLANRKTPSQ